MHFEHKYLLTTHSLTIVIEGRPYTVSSGHSRFNEIVQAVQNGEHHNKIMSLMEEQKNAVLGMLSRAMKRKLTDRVVYDDGII
jgi:hypothetical protein